MKTLFQAAEANPPDFLPPLLRLQDTPPNPLGRKVLWTLVPAEKTLRAEVRVSNEDIGLVRPGRPVQLKFAAVPLQKYCMLDGTIEHISADAADNRPNRPGEEGPAAG